MPDTAKPKGKDKKPPKPTGRPTIRTPEVENLILSRIAEGESLRGVCADQSLPAASTFLLWVSQDKVLSERYAQACDVRADAMFDEMFDIADNAENDWMQVRRKDDDENAPWVLNGEHVQRSRLRIDTRKWALARMAPKKYGDRVLNVHEGGDKPVEISDGAESRELARQVAYVLSKGMKASS